MQYQVLIQCYYSIRTSRPRSFSLTFIRVKQKRCDVGLQEWSERHRSDSCAIMYWAVTYQGTVFVCRQWVSFS